MPSKVGNLPQQDTHSEATSEVRQTVLVLVLTRTERPLLLPDYVSEKVKLGGRDQIAESDQASIGPTQADDPGVGRESYVRTEACLAHMTADSL